MSAVRQCLRSNIGTGCRHRGTSRHPTPQQKCGLPRLLQKRYWNRNNVVR